jgi:hypothetical protein
MWDVFSKYFSNRDFFGTIGTKIKNFKKWNQKYKYSYKNEYGY